MSVPQGETIAGDRADILYREQMELKRIMTKIIERNHHPGRFDDVNWPTRAANEVYGYIDRVIRHQRIDGGRPGNDGRKTSK